MILETMLKLVPDSLDYAIDFYRWLRDGETIVGANAQASPAGLQIVNVTFDAKTAVARIAGGADQARYVVSVQIKTSSGQLKTAQFGLLTRNAPPQALISMSVAGGIGVYDGTTPTPPVEDDPTASVSSVKVTANIVSTKAWTPVLSAGSAAIEVIRNGVTLSGIQMAAYGLSVTSSKGIVALSGDAEPGVTYELAILPAFSVAGLQGRLSVMGVGQPPDGSWPNPQVAAMAGSTQLSVALTGNADDSGLMTIDPDPAQYADGTALSTFGLAYMQPEKISS